MAVSLEALDELLDVEFAVVVLVNHREEDANADFFLVHGLAEFGKEFGRFVGLLAVLQGAGKFLIPLFSLSTSVGEVLFLPVKGFDLLLESVFDHSSVFLFRLEHSLEFSDF